MTKQQSVEVAPQDGSHFLALVNGMWLTVHWEPFDEGLAFETGMSGNWMFSDPLLYDEYGQAEFQYWMECPEAPRAD